MLPAFASPRGRVVVSVFLRLTAVTAAVCRYAAVASPVGLPHFCGAAEFEIDGTATKEIAADVGSRLAEQWKRYEKWLPPRLTGEHAGPLPEVRLYQSLAEYRQALAERGAALENPAVYLRDANLILLGFDGDRYGASLKAARERVKKYDEETEALGRAFAAQQKADDERFRREKTPQNVRNEIVRRQASDFRKAQAAAAAARREADAANKKLFAEAADRLLAGASHELFHAYVATRLYPPAVDRLPAWLHEGLAQLVEHGRWRDERLLIDPPPPALLQRLKPAAGQTLELPSVRELVSSADVGFLAHDKRVTDDVRLRYLTAWSLTQYLASIGALERRERLDDYALDDRADSTARFERFAGRDTAAVEAGWHAYLRKWVK